MGSPCLIPLEGYKGSVWLPLTRIEMELEGIQERIIFIRLDGKLKNNRESIIKDH